MNESIKKLWEEYRNNPENDDLRNRLLEHYHPLVLHRADRIHARLNNDEINRDDLISAGTFGLIDAISVYDPNRGLKFETFSLPKIHGAILDQLREVDWVPRLIRARRKKIDETYRVLEEKLGCRPTEEELAEFLELPLDEFRKILEKINRMKKEENPDSPENRPEDREGRDGGEG